MKRILTFTLLLIAVALGSCTYDDTPLWNKINDHEARIKALEELCQQTNTNIEALQGLVEAVIDADYITSVTPIKEGDDVVGYNITFAKGEAITIYNGADGKDGEDGPKGDTGEALVVVPEVGVKLDEADGTYYWTIDGEWLTDEQGNKIPAVVNRGEDGADGADGKDGITPRLKIEDDYWYVSYDEGQSWTKLDRAMPEGSNADVDSIFSGVVVGSDSVTFTMLDGTTFALAYQAKLEILFENTDVAYLPNSVFEVTYTIVGGDADTEVECFGDGDWRATAVKESATTGKIQIHPTVNEGRVIVIAATGTGRAVVESLSFDRGVFQGLNKPFEVGYEGGQFVIPFSTNLEYEIEVIAGDGWFTLVETRAEVRDYEIVFNATRNDNPYRRYADISFKTPSGSYFAAFQIIQRDHWNDLGTGVLYDDFLSSIYEIQSGNSVSVAIEEHPTKPGYYRMVNPYSYENVYSLFGGIGVPEDLSFTVADIEIDAMDPDNVIIPYQFTGLSISGYGGLFIGTHTPGRVLDGRIAFDVNTIIWGTYDKSTLYFANHTGCHSIVLPEGTVVAKSPKVYVDVEAAGWGNCNAWVWDLDTLDNIEGGIWPGSALGIQMVGDKEYYVWRAPSYLDGKTVGFIVNNGPEQTVDLAVTLNAEEPVYVALTSRGETGKWSASINGVVPDPPVYEDPVVVIEDHNWGVIGGFTQWSEDIPMTIVDGVATATFTVTSLDDGGNEFKVRADGEWGINYGFRATDTLWEVPIDGTPFPATYNSNNNVVVPHIGTYNLTFAIDGDVETFTVTYVPTQM